MQMQSDTAGLNTSHSLIRARSNKNKLSVIQKAEADRHRLLQRWLIVREAICTPRQLLQRRRLRWVWRLRRRLLLLPCWQLRLRLLRGRKPCGLDGLHGVGRGPGHARRGPRSGGGREWSKSDCTQTSLSHTSSSARPLSASYAEQRAANGTGLHAELVPFPARAPFDVAKRPQPCRQQGRSNVNRDHNAELRCVKQT